MPQQSRAGSQKDLFVRDARDGPRLLAWVLASCILLVLDAKTPLFEQPRTALSSAVSAFYFVADAPHTFGAKAVEALASRVELVERNAALNRQLVEMKALAGYYDSVHRENTRLRELLDAGARVPDNVLVAELIGVSSAPREIVVDKGSLSGVGVGQAVIDSEGLVGQVVEAARFTSRVLLVTDPSHSVPVRVLRNDVLTIATGTGEGLALKDVAVTLDIAQGDRLVSSGLGGRFPPGYPVGVVDSVVRDQTEQFANVVVRPSASLDRTQQVLVVFAGQIGEAPAEAS